MAISGEKPQFLSLSNSEGRVLMKQLFMALPAVVMLAACGASSSLTAARNAPALGRYAFTTTNIVYLTHTSGVLTLTYSARDSIAGTMESSDFAPRTDNGVFAGGEYLLGLYPTAAMLRVYGTDATGPAIAFLASDGAGVRCDHLTIFGHDALYQLRTWEIACTLSYIGP